VPYLIKLMADAWVVPQHIVKDRLNDGSWALDPANYVFAGPFVWRAMRRASRWSLWPMRSTPAHIKPMVDKVIALFIDPQVRFAAYKNGELDAHGRRLSTRPAAGGDGRDYGQPRVCRRI
jgi:ABC-type oligopeptide transport system substrate-binding subunit